MVYQTVDTQKVETSLPGVWELRMKAHRDERGFFLETYHKKLFEELGITDTFVQDNHSCSMRGVLRGLHYQLKRSQSKLCRVIVGEALDVIVDIRQGSPTRGQWTSVVLSAKKHNAIYIPAGFAHGFLALKDSTHFIYKCSDYYDPGDEHGIRWNDPSLKIRWSSAKPVLSDKDQSHPILERVPSSLLPHYRKK